ncbi:MAG: hypothetical protein RLN86_03190 [Cyclobacteriaceae bacterium]
MKKIFTHLLLIAAVLACAKDDAVSTIPNASWELDKIVFKVDESEEFEVLNPPSVKIDISDNSFSYVDTGGMMMGSWTLDLSTMELTITNPDGTPLVFTLVSLDSNSWIFVAQVIDLTKSEFTADEDAALDMVNRKFIEIGKDFDTELSGKSMVKIMFAMKRA